MDTLLGILAFALGLGGKRGDKKGIRGARDDDFAVGLDELPGLLIAAIRKIGKCYEGRGELRERHSFFIIIFLVGWRG